MAAIDTAYVDPMHIAGLGKPLTEFDMTVSRITYGPFRPELSYFQKLMSTLQPKVQRPPLHREPGKPSR
jgi:hypothetical protein